MHKLLLALALLLAAPVTQTCFAQTTLNIAAAADLQPLLPDILAQFQARTGVVTHASYASSATLASQITNGAPFDLFLSADLGFAQRVIDAGFAIETAPVPYARGTLVLWERKDGPIHPLTVAALESSTIQSVAIANAEHAPYGRAAMASLTHLKLLDRVQPKLRTAENISQAAQFAESGNAQLGLLSLTSASTDKLKSEGTYIEMPPDSYPPILQGAVVLKHSGASQAKAKSFLDFLLSPPISKELSARGLKPPSP